MTEPTYKESLATLATGMAKLIKCLMRTASITAHDVIHGVSLHPILTLVLIMGYISMIFSLASARAERDHLNAEIYHYEITNDSLQILIDK